MHYLTDKPIDLLDKFIDNIKDYKIVKSDSNNLDYKKPTEKTLYII
jgi:hypothetical protein